MQEAVGDAREGGNHSENRIEEKVVLGERPQRQLRKIGG